MSEPEPWNIKYLPYQKGFIQDAHNRLAISLNRLLKYYIKDPKIRKSVDNNIHRQTQALWHHKIIGVDLYNDLEYTRKARNEFVKAVGQPDEVKIREYLNQVKCIWWEESTRNKYSVYHLLDMCISQTQIALTNCDSYKVIWNELNKNAR